ncbi:hypothetical protein D3C72_1609650 [compost metagenome]
MGQVKRTNDRSMFRRPDVEFPQGAEAFVNKDECRDFAANPDRASEPAWHADVRLGFQQDRADTVLNPSKDDPVVQQPQVLALHFSQGFAVLRRLARAEQQPIGIDKIHSPSEQAAERARQIAERVGHHRRCRERAMNFIGSFNQLALTPDDAGVNFLGDGAEWNGPIDLEQRQPDIVCGEDRRTRKMLQEVWYR